MKGSDRVGREILLNLEAAQIGIASSTYDLVGLPPIKVESFPPATSRAPDSVSDGRCICISASASP